MTTQGLEVSRRKLYRGLYAVCPLCGLGLLGGASIKWEWGILELWSWGLEQEVSVMVTPRWSRAELAGPGLQRAEVLREQRKTKDLRRVGGGEGQREKGRQRVKGESWFVQLRKRLQVQEMGPPVATGTRGQHTPEYKDLVLFLTRSPPSCRSLSMGLDSSEPHFSYLEKERNSPLLVVKGVSLPGQGLGAL